MAKMAQEQMETMEDHYVLDPLEQRTAWRRRGPPTASAWLGRFRPLNQMVSNSPCCKIEANL